MTARSWYARSLAMSKTMPYAMGSGILTTAPAAGSKAKRLKEIARTGGQWIISVFFVLWPRLPHASQRQFASRTSLPKCHSTWLGGRGPQVGVVRAWWYARAPAGRARACTADMFARGSVDGRRWRRVRGTSGGRAVSWRGRRVTRCRSRCCRGYGVHGRYRRPKEVHPSCNVCLVYTSDAADE